MRFFKKSNVVCSIYHSCAALTEKENIAVWLRLLFIFFNKILLTFVTIFLCLFDFPLISISPIFFSNSDSDEQFIGLSSMFTSGLGYGGFLGVTTVFEDADGGIVFINHLQWLFIFVFLHMCFPYWGLLLYFAVPVVTPFFNYFRCFLTPFEVMGILFCLFNL